MLVFLIAVVIGLLIGYFLGASGNIFLRIIGIALCIASFLFSLFPLAVGFLITFIIGWKRAG